MTQRGSEAVERLAIPTSVARALLKGASGAELSPLRATQPGNLVADPLPAAHPDRAMLSAKRPVAMRMLEGVTDAMHFLVGGSGEGHVDA